MKPLIDADILLHEIGWSGEFKSKETGEEILLDPEYVFDLLDKKIDLICEDVGATEPPTLFITNSEWLNNELNRRHRFKGEPEEEYKPLFRYSVAVTQPYKGNRNNPKPFHFKNLIIHMLANYDVVIAKNGYEADDLLCMYQGNYDTGNGWETVPSVICSRDKDLRICPGYHFSWECGKQKAIGPEYTDELGRLIMTIVEKEKNEKIIKEKKVHGYGLKFFYYQMLVGDTADYIPGLPKWGLVRAFELIDPLTTHEEVFNAVKQAYIESQGLCKAKEYWMEQANLLWMIQKEGERYTIPKF